MHLYIDNKSGTPIYEQICRQTKEQIISGGLVEDQPLPSIRNLARDLRISVITTKRAYDELEQQGFIYTVPAKGCFVAARDLSLVREEHLRQIEEHLQQAVILAGCCGISKEEFREILDLYWEE